MEFPTMQSVSFQELLNATFGLLVIVIPLALSWYARTYLKSAESQKRITVITALANAAMNYAEDVEHRGELALAFNSLDLPQNVTVEPTVGNQKLYVAGSWLVDELRRMGTKRISVQEAVRWVSAEYQKNVGDMHAMHSVTAITDLATDLLKQLSRNGHIKLPGNTLDAVSLIQSIADWAALQSVDVKYDKVLQRDAAMARISPASLMAANSTAHSTNKIAPEVRITLLARRATEFVNELQRQGKLTLSEKETAKAFIIQQAQLDGLAVTPALIDSALAKAFDQKAA